VTYTILPAASLLQVHTYKAGLLGTVGHEHDVRAHGFAGTVTYDARDPSASRVALRVSTDSLLVVAANDSSDIPDITRSMRERALAVAAVLATAGCGDTSGPSTGANTVVVSDNRFSPGAVTVPTGATVDGQQRAQRHLGRGGRAGGVGHPVERRLPTHVRHAGHI